MAFGWFSKSGDGVDKGLAKAQKLKKQERWAEALYFFEEALARDPGSEPASTGEAECREQLVASNIEEAESYREIDLPKAREHARLALDLAGAHEALRKRASAVIDALGNEASPAAALTPSPTPRRALFSQSCSCATPCTPPTEPEFDEGEIDVEDLADFYLDSCEPAVQAAFERLGGAFRTGFVHLQRGELAEALPHLEQTAREQPDECGAFYALGLLESLGGRLDAARAHFARSLGLDDAFAPALRHLAETLRDLGDRPKVIEILTEWLEVHGDDAEARLLLALTRMEVGDPARAVEDARLAHRLAGESDPRPALLLAKAYQLTGDGQAAIATLQSILARRPDSVEALAELGELLLQQGGSSAERAAEAFKRCYQHDPDRGWWYLIKVAQAYHARGWTSEAKEVLSRAREELPEETEAVRAWEQVAHNLSS